jgi:hypothetical protein
MPRSIRTWTSDLTERLIELRKENLSFGKIAVRLSEETGVTITRDAVLGRARRLHFANRLAKPDKKVVAKPVVKPAGKPAPVQSRPSSVPPSFSVELGRFRMSIAFEHIGGRSQKTA